MVRVTDNHIIKNYLDDLALQGKSERMVSDYHSCIRLYHHWLNEKKLHICSVNNMDGKGIIEDFLKYLRFEYKKPHGGSISYKRLKSVFTALNGLYEYLEYNKCG